MLERSWTSNNLTKLQKELVLNVLQSMIRNLAYERAQAKKARNKEWFTSVQHAMAGFQEAVKLFELYPTEEEGIIITE